MPPNKPVGGRFEGISEDPAAPEQPTHAWRQLLEELQAAKSYGLHFLNAKIDGLKLTVRKVMLFAVLGILGLLAGAAVIITAAVLICVGLAQALGRLVGYAWVGNLAVGILILGGILGGAWLMIRSMLKAHRQQTVRRYEQQLRQERMEHGHDVRQEAQSI